VASAGLTITAALESAVVYVRQEYGWRIAIDAPFD
jgi:hypothetical protein